jgi:hypothetical protein
MKFEKNMNNVNEVIVGIMTGKIIFFSVGDSKRLVIGKKVKGNFWDIKEYDTRTHLSQCYEPVGEYVVQESNYLISYDTAALKLGNLSGIKGLKVGLCF